MSAGFEVLAAALLITRVCWDVNSV